MYLNSFRRVAAAVAVTAIPMSAAPVAAAAPPPENSLDAGPVDVAAISFDGTEVGLRADDAAGRENDPGSLVYTTEARGVEVGWDTTGIDAGTVFGDTVTLALRTADGPAGFHADPLRLPVGERGTTVWTFPEPGRYALTFAVDAHLLTGTPVTTEETYTVAAREAPAGAQAPARSAPEPTAESTTESTAEPPPPAAPLAARAQPAPTTPGAVVLSEGHVDAVAPRILDGKPQIQVKDGTTVGQSGGQVRWREPANVVFRVKPEAATALPGDPALSFLGKKGDEIFLLPQQQQTGILWTGWSTEELRADQVSGPITWRLTGVDGPGAFGVFTTGSFGDSTVLFDSTDGLPDSHPVALGTHAHANWGFAKQGTYRLTFDVSVTLTGGRTGTDTEVYTFAVGDTDPGGVRPGGGATGDTPGGTSGGTAGDERPGGGPGLAYTGVSGVLPLTAGGVVLLGLGGAVVLAGRKRRIR